MCFIMLAMGKGDKISIIKSTENEMETNKDGYALISDAGDHIRTVDVKEFKRWIEEKKAELNKTKAVLLHYRLGTNGEQGIGNVHLWRFGEWYMCHNGGFYKWSNGSNRGECDSFKFFNNYQDYIKTSKWEKLKEKFEEDGSYGVIAGLNPSRGLYFWMGSPHKTFVAIKRGMVVITSAEWRMKKVYNLLGWKIERASDEFVYGEYSEWIGKVGTVDGTVLWEKWGREKPQKWNYDYGYGYYGYKWRKEREDLWEYYR